MSDSDHKDITESVCVQWADKVVGTQWLYESSEGPEATDLIIQDPPTRFSMSAPCVPSATVLCTTGVGGVPPGGGLPGILIPPGNPPAVPDVPIPSSAWLMLGALGMLSLWMTKQKRAKTAS